MAYTFDTQLNLPKLGSPSQPYQPFQPTFSPSQAGSGQGLSVLGSLPGLAGRMGQGVQLLNKFGKLTSLGAKMNKATPWGLAGTGASVLGNLLAKKHAKTGGALSGAGSGAAMGATIGSVVPGIGTAVGGAIGGLIGGIKGFFGGKKKNKEKKAAEAAAKAGAVGGSPYGSWMEAARAGQQQYTPFQPFNYAGAIDQIRATLPGGARAENLPGMPKDPYNTGQNLSNYGSFGG